MDNQMQELTKLENVIIGTLSSLFGVILYATGVNISKESIYSRPVLITTIAISYISSYILDSSMTYVLRRYHDNKKNKQKRK